MVAQPLPPAAIHSAALSVATTNDGDVIDLAVLAKTVGNQPEKIRKYALMFVESMYDTRLEVKAALGHRAKSSARTVGAITFTDLCQALERYQRVRDYDQARHHRANATLAGTDSRTN